MKADIQDAPHQEEGKKLNTFFNLNVFIHYKAYFALKITKKKANLK